MKRYFKALLTMVTVLLIIIAIPQVVRAEATTTISAYAKDGYTHLEWDVAVDAGVYNISSYKIYRGLATGFSVEDSSLIVAVYDPTTRYYDDYDIASKQKYYYVVRPVDTTFGDLAVSNEVYSAPQVDQPHGFYDNKTTKCSICHSSHGSKSAGLIKAEISSMEDLCKICHEEGGESSKTLKHSEKFAVFKECNQCHNPHGNNDDQNYVPMLLQVTIGGKVYFQANNLDNGVGNNFCLVSECHVNYPDFKYQPPQQNKAHDSKEMVPNSATGITCNGCHDLNGSELPNMIRQQVYWNDKVYPIDQATNYNVLCLSCHEDQKDAWGKHENLRCYECHDPHGRDNREAYLKDSYAFSVQTNANIENNFKVCFNSCHDVNSLTEISSISTNFSGKNADGEIINLHVSHLENQQDSTQRALCRDCHRPHGVDLEENPDKVMNIGFQPADTSTYLKAYDYDTPRYINKPLEIDTRNGACNLSCHGVKHSEINEGDGVYSVYQSEAESVSQAVYEEETVSVPVSIYEPVDETVYEPVDETVYQSVY